MSSSKKSVCFFHQGFDNFVRICRNTHIPSNRFSSQQLSLLLLSSHIAPNRLAVAKAEFDSMLRDGTARHAEGLWSSALHLTHKKDSGWWPCGDYRDLNARTIPDRYPVSHIQDYAHHLSGCTIFSKIDLRGLITRFLSTLMTSK
jgi:hypothetical protein